MSEKTIGPKLADVIRLKERRLAYWAAKTKAARTFVASDPASGAVAVHVDGKTLPLKRRGRSLKAGDIATGDVMIFDRKTGVARIATEKLLPGSSLDNPPKRKPRKASKKSKTAKRRKTKRKT
jgi:hypothetical protein